jgi:hypothetical protein
MVFIAERIARSLTLVSEKRLCGILNLPCNVRKEEWDGALKPLLVGHNVGKDKPSFGKIEVSSEELVQKLVKRCM